MMKSLCSSLKRKQKHIVLISLLLFGSYISYAQNVFPDTGKVGIGTLTPRSRLEVKEWIPALSISSGKYTEIMADNEVIGSINFYKHYGIAHAAAIKLLHAGGPNQYAQAHLAFYTGETQNPFTSIPIERMRIASNGDVMIGTTLSHGYKFSVNGNIRAKEIKVEATDWPDYVFKAGYQLLNLHETENYINTHKHLPGVPAAAIVEKEGIALGEMNKILLKKIEELTLHLIDQHKSIRQQQDQLQIQSRTIQDLKQEINQQKVIKNSVKQKKNKSN
ncbi:hypothetical protein ACFE6N_07525 [Pedobacter sp. BG31]|uniref:hypothetical protein n=1 Tax=Pedobacter sp. BG31 TaxID=3349697 RepID=UPI0035F3DDAF